MTLGGPTTFLAVVLLDRGRAAGIAAGVLVVMCLRKAISAIAPDNDPIAVVSAFRHFDLKDLIRAGTYPVGDSLVFAVPGVLGWVLAPVAFRRRDLAV